MTWLHKALNQGLTSLAVYNWERTPSREQDAMDLMVNAWYTALTFNRVWEYDRDIQRVHDAFLILTTTCRSWPSPREFLDVLPPVSANQKALTHSLEVKDRAAAEARMREIADELKRRELTAEDAAPVSRGTEREKIDTTAVEADLGAYFAEVVKSGRAATEKLLQTHYANLKTQAAGDGLNEGKHSDFRDYSAGGEA